MLAFVFHVFLVGIVGFAATNYGSNDLASFAYVLMMITAFLFFIWDALDNPYTRFWNGIQKKMMLWLK